MINRRGHEVIRNHSYTLRNRNDAIYELAGIYLDRALVKSQDHQSVWVDIDDLIRYQRGKYAK